MRIESTLKVIDALCRSMPAGCNINQASRISGVGLGTVHRTLKAMEKRNEVLKKKAGNNLFYRPNLRNATTVKYCELASIEKRKRVLSGNPAVAGGLLGLKDVADSVVLFGSVARGSTKPNDVDVLLLFSRKKSVVSIQKSVPKRFSPIYMGFGEFIGKLRSGEKLALEIIRDGVVVSGEGLYWEAVGEAYEKA